MSVDGHPPEAVIDPPVEAVAPVAAPRVLGRLQEFDPRVDNMSTYLERLELYFDANAVEASRKVAVLLTVIGSRHTASLSHHPTLPWRPFQNCWSY